MLPRVEILGTERQTISSKIMDQKYDLFVNFPRTYWDPAKRDKYPVLYVLNGQWDFSLMAGIFGNQNFDGLVPEIIIVGITWSNWENEILDFVGLGLRDFTPIPVDGINNSGGAARFLSVIKEEIIPFIESEYPVTEDRGLAGGSISGLFTLYAMFTETRLFKRYIASSPTTHFGNNFLFQYEEEFSKINDALPVHLCISWGELEDSSMMKHFISRLRERNYKELNLESIEIKGTGHAGNKPEGFTRGLLSVYRKAGFSLTHDQLAKYAGDYLSPEKNKIAIIIKDGNLVFKQGQEDKHTALLAETASRFYVNGSFIVFSFSEDEFKSIQLKIELWDKTYHLQKFQ